jgi:uncharacterized LabA/DUF88 family protein
MKIAPYIDRMVLFSGDGDFRSLVQAVHRRGVRSSSPACRRSRQCAQELRRQADEFIDIKAQNKISGDPVRRPARDITICPAYNRLADQSRRPGIR